MKKINKLVALLLAAVMVLGMMPTMTAHAHEYHTHGIEEYPEIALDTPATVTVAEEGYTAYFTFTPEVTEKYHFYSVNTGEYADTYGALYDAEMNLLLANDDSYESITNYPNFCVTEVLEAGNTYVLSARLYSAYNTGEFSVTLTTAHSYTSAVTQEPTCTEDGVLTYTCEYCDESYTEAIPAGHVWGDDGICTVCGETYLITGVCGDDLTWTLDWDGVLTVSGTGAMHDYVYSYYGEGSAPWYVAYNYEITKIILEEGVTTIGNNAFLYCRNATEISLPSTLVSIGEQGLANTGLINLELPEGLTTLGSAALNANYSLESVTMPSTLTTIGDNAFYGCSSLTEVVVPESVTALGEYAFYQCGNLKSITLPSTLTTIPNACFGYCSALTTIGWPTALTTIGDNAFYGCSGFAHLALPEGVTTVGQYAFGGGPKQVTMPSTLTTLADYALASCWSMTDIYFKGDAPTTEGGTAMGEYTFSYTTTTAWYPEGNKTWTEDVLQNYNGTVTWKALCAEHDFSQWTTVEATCEVGEYMTRSCSVCGIVENGPEGEPLGHDYVYETVEPDCSSYSYGYDLITCTRCDYYSQENWVYPEHAYVETVVDATCTEGGYTTDICSVCGTENSWNRRDYTEALGHNVAEWSEPSELTCEEDSVKTGYCSNCEQTITEVVEEAIGHVWDEENPVENADGTLTYSCVNCDATYTTEGIYLNLGDNQFTITGTEGEETKTYTAAETGTLTITVSDMYWHNTWAWDNGYATEYWQTLAIDWTFSEGMFTLEINGEAAAYTVEGSETAAKIITVLEVNAGDVVNVSMDHVEDKSYYGGNDVKVNMNLALVPAHTHEYTAAVTTEATCTEAGVMTYTCECGDSYTETIEALGHDFVNGDCSRCDAVMDATFEDVPVGSFFFDSVEWAVQQGITTGATETTFNPNGDLQRAAVVTMLWRAAGKPEPTTTENPFTDVKETDFFYKAVLWAVEEEITNGTSATEFSPYGVTNRAQAVTFLWRYLDKPESTATNSFTDVEAGMWYEAPINWAVEKGITNGMGDGTFGITRSCNRAQMVTFMYRALAE